MPDSLPLSDAEVAELKRVTRGWGHFAELIDRLLAEVEQRRDQERWIAEKWHALKWTGTGNEFHATADRQDLLTGKICWILMIYCPPQLPRTLREAGSRETP